MTAQETPDSNRDRHTSREFSRALGHHRADHRDHACTHYGTSCRRLSGDSIRAVELLEQLRVGAEDAGDELLKTGLVRLQAALRCQELDLPETSGGAPDPPEDKLNLGDDSELIRDFVVEAGEHLSSIEANLLVLEKDPLLLDTVHSVFRSFHTIKGLSGFLQLKPLLDVAHETETMLDHALERRIEISPRVIDIALKAADYIRTGLEGLSVKPAREAMRSLKDNSALIREISSTSTSALLPVVRLDRFFATAKTPGSGKTHAPSPN